MAERTKAGALAVVLGHREASGSLMTSDRAKTIMSDRFLADLLDLAWQNQFEQDRSAPRRALRQLIADAIEADRLNGAPQ